MYIQPNTVIRILKNVPLDKTYEHTIYFSDVSSQVTYFSSKAKHVLSNQTYQRLQKGVARVQLNAESLYDCNYMMFQNTSFGSKWFYAFITGVEYVNDVTSDVYFEIDVMQTWFFDYTPNQCFVEREHSVSDVIGEHIEPENVETGEYVSNNYGILNALNNVANMCIIVAINTKTTTPQGVVATAGKLINGVYSGATLIAFRTDDISSLQRLLNAYLEAPDSIVNMYMCPINAIAPVPVIPDGGIPIEGDEKGIQDIVTKQRLGGSNTIDGYVPRNNKLFTYPYNFYHIDNANGEELTLRYEFFSGLVPKFSVEYVVTYPPKVIVRPMNYKNVSGTSTYNLESISISDYPVCSWNVDAYKAWVAQNSVPIGLNVSSSILSAGANAVTGNYIGAGLSAYNTATNIMTEWYKASISAPISKGSFNNGGVNIAHKKQNFYTGAFSITQEYARMIDDFFTKYGYSTKRLKRPNRSSRPHWNYVKTIGATITGSVPADDMNTICGIYDNGITFWRNGDEVGNYSLNNSPA